MDSSRPLLWLAGIKKVKLLMLLPNQVMLAGSETTSDNHCSDLHYCLLFSKNSAIMFRSGGKASKG
jgi:hypothetical protein